jgi:shikimate kinase
MGVGVYANEMMGLTRTIALVGMMGVGKSSVGRRLASRLDVAFRDADSEIEAAAGCSINEIFDRYGEDAFRDGERKVLARLLGKEPHVLATGGGAFIDDEIRAGIKTTCVSVWLKAPLDLLVERVSRRNTRPMLRHGDLRENVARLLEAREPIYAEADLVVESEDGPHGKQVERILKALEERGFVEAL